MKLYEFTIFQSTVRQQMVGSGPRGLGWTDINTKCIKHNTNNNEHD